MKAVNFSQRCEGKTDIKSEEETDAPKVGFRFQIRCFISKIEHLKSQILHVLTPVKMRRGVGEMSESVLQVPPRTKPLIYFWQSATWLSGILHTRCQIKVRSAKL